MTNLTYKRISIMCEPYPLVRFFFGQFHKNQFNKILPETETNPAQCRFSAMCVFGRENERGREREREYDSERERVRESVEGV